jgi:hypothetical protein
MFQFPLTNFVLDTRTPDPRGVWAAATGCGLSFSIRSARRRTHLVAEVTFDYTLEPAVLHSVIGQLADLCGRFGDDGASSQFSVRALALVWLRGEHDRLSALRLDATLTRDPSLFLIDR